MESTAEPNRVDISESTYEAVKHLFECEDRGEIKAKNAGALRMFFLNRLKPEYSSDPDGLLPIENLHQRAQPAKLEQAQQTAELQGESIHP